MRAVITKAGELRAIYVLNGHTLLVPAAVGAIKQWRYAPCLMFNNGEAVEVVTYIDPLT